MDEKEIVAGGAWGRIDQSKRAHYFGADGYSLCGNGKWFHKVVSDEGVEDGEKCIPCKRRLDKILNPPAPKVVKPRPINEDYELALELATEFGNPGMVMGFLKHIKAIRASGESPEIAAACWRDLRKSGDDPTKILPEGGPNWTLLSVLGGHDGGRINQFKRAILDGVPPVWDSSEHDGYVLRWASVLSKVGFVYRGGRIGSGEPGETEVNHEVFSD